MSSETESNTSANSLQLDEIYNEATMEFIEKVGLLFDSYGVPRIGGRIFGLMTVAHRPLNTDDIMAILNVSRTAVSTNLKMGLATGFVKISHKREPGDRRDYYEHANENGKAFMDSLRSRTKQWLELNQVGLGAVKLVNPVAAHRLTEEIAMYELTLEWIDKLDEAWKQLKSELDFE